MGPSASTSTITYGIAVAPNLRRPFWLSLQRRRQPAIDRDLLAGNVSPAFRREQDGNAREVARLAPAPQRHSAVHVGDEILVLKHRHREVRLEIARRDGVAGDAVA